MDQAVLERNSHLKQHQCTPIFNSQSFYTDYLKENLKELTGIKILKESFRLRVDVWIIFSN